MARWAAPHRDPPAAGESACGRPVLDGIVKIYLLSIDRRRFFFYADESEPPDDRRDGDDASGPASGGWRGWLKDRGHRLQAAWEHSDAGAVRWTRKAWDWLHSWAHPDETMLGRLLSARRIELHHPASRDAAEVRTLWHEYLDHRWWRHVLWMSANGLIAPPALVTLWVLPGPNVIGYWFAYRAIHHAMIVWGIRRVRRGQVELELRPMPELDWPIEFGRDGKARHAALEGEAPHLEEHVAWTESEPSVMVDSEGPPPDRPPADRADIVNEGS
jgi:Mitochondrial K+-H+ exchange-related